MQVKLNLFYPGLLEAIHYPDDVRVEGATIAECLASFVRQFPKAQKWLFDEDGRLLDQVFVFVNAETRDKTDLSGVLRPGDEIFIAQAIMGG